LPRRFVDPCWPGGLFLPALSLDMILPAFAVIGTPIFLEFRTLGPV
jgi:hypothetical protein